MHASYPTFLALSILTLFCAFPGRTSAQLFDTADAFGLTVTPAFPMPYGEVLITPSSKTLDLTRALMTVSSNTKEIYRGTPKAVTVSLGEAGSLTTVVVTMDSNGSTKQKTLTLRPQEAALVVEPLSTAPALYPGKPLVPLEGEVRLVALARFVDTKGKEIDPDTLSYAWSVDGGRVAAASGIGRKTLTVGSPLQYRVRTVSVTVSTQDGALMSGASLTLDPKEPTLRLYEHDPLLGTLYDHAVAGTYTVPSAEKTLMAAPFSFPVGSGGPSLQWFLNGAPAQTGNLITLRPTGSGTGSATLSLLASSGDLLKKTVRLSLDFGTKEGLFGIFGL